MISRAIAVVSFASLTCIRPLAAQTPPDMVPMEFVRMLSMTPVVGGMPEVAVGRLPDRLARDLGLGTDARIIGSMISPRFSASALVMQGRSTEVQERLVARLVETGWKELTLAPAPQVGGFETGPRRQPRGPLTLCSTDDQNIQLNVNSHAGDSVAVHFFLSRGGYGASCVDPELTGPRPNDQAPLPALRAPAGTDYRGGGGGGGSRDGYADARLRTDMQPAALLDHYATQMIAAGWQAGARSASDAVALQVFRTTNDSRNWQGVLSVIVLANGERELHLRVTRER